MKLSDLRKWRRAPVSLEVQYRTAGSFLVSYSQNLSKGGLFLEGAELLPVGTPLAVRFTIPGADRPIELQATVKWVRAEAGAPDEPAGMGLAFDAFDSSIGQQIDQMVRGFSRVKLMAVAGDPAATARLARSLSNVLNCAVVRPSSTVEAVDWLDREIDLVLIDLDSVGESGLLVVGAANNHLPRIPLIALSREPELVASGETAGANFVLDNPPSHSALRTRILELLGKPIRAPVTRG